MRPGHSSTRDQSRARARWCCVGLERRWLPRFAHHHADARRARLGGSGATAPLRVPLLLAYSRLLLERQAAAPRPPVKPGRRERLRPEPQHDSAAAETKGGEQPDPEVGAFRLCTQAVSLHTIKNKTNKTQCGIRTACGILTEYLRVVF